MKRRGIVWIGLGVAGLLLASLVLRSNTEAQKAVQEARSALREQGFKTDLADFDFSTSAEQRSHEAALTNTALNRSSARGLTETQHMVLQENRPELLETVGPDSAIVAWKAPQSSPYFPGGYWAVLREVLNDKREALDAACAATRSGPIAFHLDANRGHHMLLPHLPGLKNLTQLLGRRIVLELHDRNQEAAWTNLVAATRLVAAWEPGPSEVSQLVRFALVPITYRAVWQVLQNEGWSDDQLAGLQREWEGVEFLKRLPETAAFQRACMAATCQLERQQPLGGSGITLSGLLNSPWATWQQAMYEWRTRRYRRVGTYEDERALLLHYRDRELELRRAIQSPTWSEMRALPGVTNRLPFQSKHSSAMQAMMNTREISLRVAMQGQGLLGRAADAEAHRRLIVTALALERYRGRQGSYPENLLGLVPEFLPRPPVDFMDGQPLRYRLADDGHFVLYSVGLDCVDDGGTVQRPDRPRPSYWPAGMPDRGPPEFGIPQGIDLVWPRPASAAEAAARKEAEARAREDAAERAELARAAEQVEEEALRQATVKQLLTKKPARRTKEPTFEGRLLSDVLRNTNSPGAERLSLDGLLTLRQFLTGQEPDVATFELPIRFDAVTNLGELDLLVDTEPGEDAPDGGGEMQECARATNGNCLLVWTTLYDPPGQHALQARLLLYAGREDAEGVELTGPVAPFFSSNLFHFDPYDAYFGARGATLGARLIESNATYRIDIRSPTRDPVRTFRGATSNGVIRVRWDLWMTGAGPTRATRSTACSTSR
jgi:hypothetical protein